MSTLLGALLGITAVVVCVAAIACVVVTRQYQRRYQQRLADLNRLAFDVVESQRNQQKRSIELIDGDRPKSNDDLRGLNSLYNARRPIGQTWMPPTGMSTTRTTTITTTTTNSRTPSPRPPDVSCIQKNGQFGHNTGMPALQLSAPKPMLNVPAGSTIIEIGDPRGNAVNESTSFFEPKKKIRFTDSAVDAKTKTEVQPWHKYQTVAGEESKLIAKYFEEPNNGGANVEFSQESIELMKVFIKMFPTNKTAITFKGIINKYKPGEHKKLLKEFASFYSYPPFRKRLSRLGQPGPPVERDFSLESGGNQLLDLYRYQINRALVAMIGIGEYNVDAFPELEGIRADYCNMIETWTEYWGYDFMCRIVRHDRTERTVFMTKESLKEQRQRYMTQHDPALADPLEEKHRHNSYRYYGDGTREQPCPIPFEDFTELTDAQKAEQPKKNYYRFDFKQRWIFTEIDEFVGDVKAECVRRRPDALIFLVSAHGESGVIFDAVGQKYQLGYLFTPFEFSKKLKDMVYCPKIFFIDTCRGDARPTPLSKDTTRDYLLREAIPSKRTMESRAARRVREAQANKNAEQKEDPSAQVQQELQDQNLVVGATHPGVGKAIVPTRLYRPDLDANEKDPKVMKQSNFMKIFAVYDEVSTADGGRKGGYLMRAVKRAMKHWRGSEIPLKKCIEYIRDEGNKLCGDKNYLALEVLDDIQSDTFFEAQFDTSDTIQKAITERGNVPDPRAVEVGLNAGGDINDKDIKWFQQLIEYAEEEFKWNEQDIEEKKTTMQLVKKELKTLTKRKCETEADKKRQKHLEANLDIEKDTLRNEIIISEKENKHLEAYLQDVQKYRDEAIEWFDIVNKAQKAETEDASQ